MPGFLVHLGALVQCAHQGLAKPSSPVSNVLVSGQPIVTIASPYTVAGCTYPSPPTANGPCTAATFTSASLKVTSFGQAVLLSDSISICVSSGTPLRVATTQTRVSGT